MHSYNSLCLCGVLLYMHLVVRPWLFMHALRKYCSRGRLPQPRMGWCAVYGCVSFARASSITHRLVDGESDSVRLCLK